MVETFESSNTLFAYRSVPKVGSTNWTRNISGLAGEQGRCTNIKKGGCTAGKKKKKDPQS